MATLDARREALDALRSRTATAMEALPRAESAEERLSRQVESNRALAERLKVDYRNALMAERVEAGQVEIVDLAALPYQPVARLGTLRLVLGVLIGVAVGSIGALMIDSRTAQIRGRPDLEVEMRLPVLSVIPPIRVVAKGGPRLSRLTGMLHREHQETQLPAFHSVDGDGQHRGSTTAATSSAGAEAFRLLRSSLKWTQRDEPGKTLVVSSALSGEGKTTTSANLAVVCACEGKRVLLIDCDVRRPQLHRMFRLPRQPGIAQVLRSGLSPAAAIRDTFIEGVSFLPAGSNGSRFADLLGSDRMRSLLHELSERFDMIVLDTPPVLAVADTAALAPLVDATLLVVGAGTTNRHAVEQALQQLEGVGAHVIGAVLNDARGEVQRYSGYYQYYYPYQDDYYAPSPGTA
jgi:tyrosine-protein kinase Etk/Wzc